MKMSFDQTNRLVTLKAVEIDERAMDYLVKKLVPNNYRFKILAKNENIVIQIQSEPKSTKRELTGKQLSNLKRRNRRVKPNFGSWGSDKADLTEW